MIEPFRAWIDRPGATAAMPLFKALFVSSVGFLLLVTVPARSDDWTTVGLDAQRSSWVRADAKITEAALRSGEFQFLWRLPLEDSPRSGNAATVPVLLDFLISHRGFRSLAFVGTSSGGIFAMDTDLARMEWERQFSPGPKAASEGCPRGMTANLTRATSALMPSTLGFLPRGRRSPAKGGVGEPKAGAVTLLEAARRTSASAQPARTARTRAPARPSLRGVTLVYALSAGGLLHALYASNGRDHVPPMRFLPGGATTRGLIVVDGVAYATTADGCGGVKDGVWALDLETGKVSVWESSGSGIAGLSGAAFSPDGTAFVTTRTGALIALGGKSLERADATTAIGFRSSPVVFDWNGEDHVAALARDGTLHVFAADSLSTTVARATGGIGGDAPTALASWRDSEGARWLLVPGKNSIGAWTLAGDAGSIRLAKVWELSGLEQPLPPIIVNGIVFALDGGSSSGPARLYALEGRSGARLWDSGDTISAEAAGHTLSSGPGRVFLTTADSAVYAFGIPMEH